MSLRVRRTYVCNACGNKVRANAIPYRTQWCRVVFSLVDGQDKDVRHACTWKCMQKILIRGALNYRVNDAAWKGER